MTIQEFEKAKHIAKTTDISLDDIVTYLIYNQAFDLSVDEIIKGLKP